MIDCANDLLAEEELYFVSLFHSERCNDLRMDAVNKASSKLVSQWRRHVELKKERRGMVRSLCLVAKRAFEETGKNHGVGPVLASVLSKYDTEHSL
jgi:hypothetical protein